VCTTLSDCSVLEYENFVSVDDRCKSMSNDDGGPVGHCTFQSTDNFLYMPKPYTELAQLLIGVDKWKINHIINCYKILTTKKIVKF